jgi:hypothetical protein
MNRFATLLVIPFVMGLLGGCGSLPREVGDEETRSISEALETSNAMVPNAMVPNAMVPNAMVPNALSASALSLGMLSPSSLAALQDPGEAGALSRQFVRYAVGCAFVPGQALSFTWTDDSGIVHQEDYQGVLGLAPEWSTQPLHEGAQRWVSACLAARTNWYGQKVILSTRGVALGQPDPDELLGYPREEGAFWGNVFAPTPAVYACYNADNVDNSRAHLRDCAAGHLEPDGTVAECGIINILGPCDQFCFPVIDQGLGHIYCSADPSTLSSAAENVYVISVYLP